ncbi:hypothetical protein KY363_00770 [Candidatus Woesearchaeota archaeon]|nr:hypothetical protein [Candidatus Woesearchaeota archaeon]
MSEEKYLVKTKSGSMYPIVVNKGIISKGAMKITLPKGTAEVKCISDKSNAGEAYLADPKGASVNVDNLKPGKIIVFSLGKEAGNTSRIEEVYRRVA